MTSPSIPITDPRVRRRHEDRFEPGAALHTLLIKLREGWRAPEIIAWCRDRLVITGWIRKRDVHSPELALLEPPLDEVVVRLVGRLDAATAAEVEEVVASAAARVLTVLRALRDDPGTDGFVVEAIAARRARPVELPGGDTGWGVALREGEPFSAWLLALLAADLKNGERDYRDLGVCDVCDTVWFAKGDHRRCARHRG